MPVKIKITNTLGFAYGASSLAFIQIYGQLYISELIALCMVLYIGPISIIKCHKSLIGILTGYCLLLIGLVLADIANSSAMADALRGWASVIFAAINVIFLTDILGRNPKVLIYILMGFAVSRIFFAEIPELSQILDGGNFFKARVVPLLVPVILVVTYLVSKRHPLVAWLLLLLAALLLLALGARSRGLIILLAAALIFLMNIRPRQGQRFFVLVSLIAISYPLYTLYVTYVLSAGEGSGNAYNQLLRLSNPYNPLELLATGRSELLVAWAAISENYILGRGSWAQDHDGYYAALWARINDSQQVLSSTYIVSHSMILTAWLWGGVLGFLGILVVLTTIMRCGFKAVTVWSPYRMILIVLLTDLAWNAFFSPFGHIRTSVPLVAAMAIILAESVSSPKNKKSMPRLQQRFYHS